MTPAKEKLHSVQEKACTQLHPVQCGGMNSQILNQAAELLRSNGINPTKDLVFSACLKSLISAGFDVCTAFDIVLGDGAYDRFAGDVHSALRAQARS